MTKDDVSEQNSVGYVVKVQEAPSGELFVELPQKLIDQLGWKLVMMLSGRSQTCGRSGASTRDLL